MNDPALQQPIGYWLNRCDRAITESMNRRLDPYGVNRIDWQVLNVVAKSEAGAMSIADVHDRLRANADRDTLIQSANQLLSKSYLRCVDQNSDQLVLTERGNAFWQTLQAQIARFRDQSLLDITEEEYRITISVLERMTQNLETR